SGGYPGWVPYGEVGRVTPAGVITTFVFAGAEAQFGPIVAGPDGNLWYGDMGLDRIGRVTPTGTFTEFAPIHGEPFGIAAAAGVPDIWFTATPTRIGRISPQGAVTESA